VAERLCEHHGSQCGQPERDDDTSVNTLDELRRFVNHEHSVFQLHAGNMSFLVRSHVSRLQSMLQREADQEPPQQHATRENTTSTIEMHINSTLTSSHQHHQKSAIVPKRPHRFAFVRARIHPTERPKHKKFIIRFHPKQKEEEHANQAS
jgi:hypothetical protein